MVGAWKGEERWDGVMDFFLLREIQVVFSEGNHYSL